MKKKQLLLSLALAPLLLNADGLENAIKSGGKIYNQYDDKASIVQLDASVNSAFAGWNSGLKDKKARLTYDTESISYIETKLDLSIKGYHAFSFNNFKSSGTEDQTKALKRNTSANAGLDGLGFVFSPEFVLGLKNFNNQYVNTALSYRIKYRDESYYGTAKANEDLIYWYTDSMSGTEGVDYDRLNSGDKLSFKTDFKHTEHSVSLKYLDKFKQTKTKLNGMDMRIGYYESKYVKPAFMGYTAGGLDVVEAVEYNTKGLFLNLSNYEGVKKDKHNINASLYLGLSNDMTSNGNSTSANLAEDSTLDYSAIFVDYSYKHKILNNKDNKLYVLGGGSVDYKKWSVSNSKNDTSFDLDAETLYKVYVELNYRFTI